MLGYLKRLVTTGAAYQFGRHPRQGARAAHAAAVHAPPRARRAYGAARNAADGGDPRRASCCAWASARRSSASTSTTRTRRGASASRARRPRPWRGRRRWPRSSRWCSPAPLSQLLLGFRDPLLIDCAVLGLWAFTNLEMAYAQLRVDERARAYVLASGANVLLTVSFTVALVVFAGQGARGLLLGNFGASALRGARAVVGAAPALLAARARSRRPARDAALRAADGARRRERVRAAGRRPLLPVPRLLARVAAGLYAVAIKLATVVFVAVRGFQYAWPPLAYSIESDARGGAAVLAGHHLLRAGHGGRRVRASRCSAAGWCGCLPRTASTARTARCPGSRSAGRCTACTWCSS